MGEDIMTKHSTLESMARTMAALAIHEARKSERYIRERIGSAPVRGQAFRTFSSASSIIATTYDIARDGGDTATVKACTLAGIMLTDRSYRAMRSAW